MGAEWKKWTGSDMRNEREADLAEWTILGPRTEGNEHVGRKCSSRAVGAAHSAAKPAATAVLSSLPSAPSRLLELWCAVMGKEEQER